MLVPHFFIFITGYYGPIYIFSLPFAYSCLIVWNLFFFLFINEITEKGKRALIPFILTGIVIIFTLWLPTNWWGYTSEEAAGKLNTRLYTTGAVVLHATLIYISIILICLRAKRITNDKKTRVGFSLLAYSMICALMWLTFLIIDTLIIVYTDSSGYTIFAYIAWMFGILFMIFSYLALNMPDWFVKYIEKNRD